MDCTIVSIGVLPFHPLRGERAPLRTGHATTTLVASGNAKILVDPGLPAEVLVPRLLERTGLTPKDVTHVFLTGFHPDTHRSLDAFLDATWLIHAPERESVGVQLATALKDIHTRSEAQGGVAKEESLRAILEREVALLSRCETAPQNLAPRVDLFPLPGVTPGLCGLLVSGARFTTLLCGDAVPTWEHVAQGRAPSPAADVDLARESLAEALEIADVLVPGRDNVVLNPTKRPF